MYISKPFLYSLFFVLPHSSCTEKEDNEPLFICIEPPARKSTFSLRNNTSYNLTLNYRTTSILENLQEFKPDTLKIITPNSESEILTNALSSTNPKPIHTFKNMQLFAEINEKKVLVYEQNPIENESWNLNQQNLDKSGIGESFYVLDISDKDLK
ncbi:MAG: hypothetical protein M3Q05_06070 [Bacteroidota bacterium]|nr:hypothetical protein [Bacteroidota bacterium]